MSDPAPIIVSALFAREQQAWLEGLRRAHFPPDRNQLAAHLTLFHHLPPSIEAELATRLGGATRQAPLMAQGAAWMSLGRGTALRIDCPPLTAIRAGLAEAFVGLLTPQDRAGWRPHVTIQNKVTPGEAKTLKTAMDANFVAVPLRVVALASWRYRGGPWERIARYPFRV